jgi:Probable cobalt transporter subunit (CbtA)
MIAAAVRRGLLAGVLAGLLAGFLSFAIGEPPVQAAIRLEEAAAATPRAAATPADQVGGPPAFEVTRPAQRVGLVVGLALYGLAVGTLFAVASAWAVGRVEGGDWQRSLKLGAAAVGAVVLLPALKYPPNPPAVGDPATVGQRTTLYLGLVAIGVLLALAGWAAARQLAASGLPAPVRQTLVGVGVAAVAAAVLAAMPTLREPVGLPADLLWSFRLASIATQAILYGGTAVLFGLLAVRARARASAP